MGRAAFRCGFADCVGLHHRLGAHHGLRALGRQEPSMSLQHLWELSYDSKTIDILRNAKYAIPMIQSLHLFGLTLVLGTAVIFNLRLLGFGMRKITMPVLDKQLWRVAIGGLFLSIATGLLVFIPDPARYAANTAFKTKLVLLSLAILFHFTI